MNNDTEYDDGYASYWAGIDIGENPYVDDVRASEWEDGWLDAQEEELDEGYDDWDDEDDEWDDEWDDEDDWYDDDYFEEE